jgi:hypothetical protein
MWKMQDDVEAAEPGKASPSTQRPDFLSHGDALGNPVMNEDFQQGDSSVVSRKAFTEDSDQPASRAMKKYTEAVTEFTNNATAFIEHLPLLTKARDAYQEAMRASTEMRTALDASDGNLRVLMTQLEQRINLRELKPANKKPPEAAKVEKIKELDEGGGRAFRWP